MTSLEGATVATGPRAPRPPVPPATDRRAGIVTALLAYLLWGVLPVYFKAIDHIEPVTVVAFRILFSLVFVGLVVCIRGQAGEVRAALAAPRVVLTLSVSALLVAVNWLTFIWAVANDRILDTSFGYFINPMISVMIGLVLLGEKMTRPQWIAAGITLVAIAIQAIGLGAFPVVSIVLALTFAFYGYVRKTVSVGSTPGLAVETIVLLPPALAYIAYVWLGPLPDHMTDPQTYILLSISGPATAIPLLLFAFAARQLPLSMIGMYQYIAPTMGFVTAIFWFGEPLETPRLISFALIWLSLAIFSAGSFRNRKASDR